MSNLLATINRISEHKAENFAAPILTQRSTRVCTIQNDIPYWYNVRVEEVGWYELEPDGDKANTIKNINFVEIEKYLGQLKRFLVFALYPVSAQTWMVSPYNTSDAWQRGWNYTTQRRMYLARGNVKPLDVIDARLLGQNFLFRRVEPLYWKHSMSLPSRELAQALVEERLEQLQKEQEEKLRQIRLEKERQDRAERMQTARGRIEESLKFSGAELQDVKTDVHGGYNVTWMYDGRTYTMPVDENLHVVSAGVCLAGNDNWYTLSSIIGVMEDRQRAIDAGDHGDY